MATTERPKSRLENGRVNPEYTAWRKANKDAPASVEESIAADPEKPLSAWIESPQITDEMPTDALVASLVEQVFQSAAEPEQTTNDDPREPEFAPALEALSLRVVGLARNNAFVYCDLNGERVAVVVKKGSGPRLIGRTIPVVMNEASSHYTHQP